MDRNFDYEDARRLCASHKQILDTIQKTLKARSKDADKVRQAATEVFGSKVLASQIASALQSGNVNVAMQPNEKMLIQAVYICDEGEKIVSALQDKEQTRRDVIRDIGTLSSASSPLKWFFSGKQGKEAAIAAYQRLSGLLQGDYPSLVKGLEEKSRALDDVSVNDAYGAVSGKEQSYLPCLTRMRLPE